MIPIRWQLYLVLTVAFVVGVFGIRAKWLAEGESRMRAKLNKDRLEAARAAREVENEIEALDRDTLKRRAAGWVRDNGKR